MPDAPPRPSTAVIWICDACFSIGALNHAHDFATHGWRPYDWGNGPLEVFWTSLLPLDSLAAALLLSRFRRTALLLSVAIMVLDVGANSYAFLVLGFPAFGRPLPLQAAFLGFLLGSIAFVWPPTLRRSAR